MHFKKWTQIYYYYCCYQLRAGYLQVHTWKTLCFLGIQCCSYSAVMIHVILFRMMNLSYIYIRTLRSTRAVSNMGVFCSYLFSCFPSMLPRYFLNYFQIVPVTPIIIGITFICTFTMPCISIVRCLYFRIFLASSLIRFLSPETAVSNNTHEICTLLGY